MALKRRSALQAAEKLVSRGRLEAAVSQYRKALEESPNDTGTLNRLGDLYARLSRVPEAVQMFSTAAEHFTREGFFVKAIAIYKKIIRLDPTLIQVYETLADLYHRQGLVNEARAQYQVVADYYRQSDDQGSLIAVYEKMVELEPDNPSHRLKVAEFYCAAERIPEAMEQYLRIATFMLRHGKVEEALKVCLGAYELKIDDLGFLTDVIVQLTDLGREDLAQRLLDEAIRRNPDAARVAELVDLPVVAPTERRGAALDSTAAQVDHAEVAVESVDGGDESEWREARQDGAAPVSEAAEVDLEPRRPDSMVEGAGRGGGAEVSVEPTDAGFDQEGSAAEDFDLIDPSELVSLEPSEFEPQVDDAVAEFEPRGPESETGEIEIDLDEIEAAAWRDSPSAVEVPVAGAPKGDESVAAREETQLESDPVVRAEELLVEANVLSNYGLESKAVELLETALGLVPDHLDAGKLLLHLHHQAGRFAAVCEVAERFLRAEALPEPLAELLDDWEYQLDGGRVLAPAAESREPRPKPVELESTPVADVRLGWLDEEPMAAQESDDESDMFGEEDQFFDLAAELEQELLAEETKLGVGGRLLPEEQSIEEIVEGFKQGIAETLSAEDYDTHYNLGIAYREMGLIDEAIGEFQLAARSTHYLVDCCSLLGASFLEKGFPDLAVKWFERGLSAPGASDEEKLGLLYELGNLHLATGNREIARSTFAEIYGANSNYRDVVAKLEELRQA